MTKSMRSLLIFLFFGFLYFLSGCASDTQYSYWQRNSETLPWDKAYSQCRYEEHLMSRAERATGGGGFPVHILFGMASETEQLCMKRFGWDYVEIINKSKILEREKSHATSAFKDGDYKTALPIFQKWALDGDRTSQFAMGSIHAFGDGKEIKKDSVEAFKWHLMAAKQADKDSELFIGKALFFGDGVEKNFKNSLIWTRSSANHGNLDAFSFMAFLHMNPEVGEVDLPVAHALAKLAIKNDDKVKKILELIEPKMTEEDFKKSLTITTSCIAKKSINCFN